MQVPLRKKEYSKNPTLQSHLKIHSQCHTETLVQSFLHFKIYFILISATADQIPRLLTDLLTPGRKNVLFHKSAHSGRKIDTRKALIPKTVLKLQ